MSVKLWVHGEPYPQGSMRAMVDKRTGQARIIPGGSNEAMRKHKAWRKAVTTAAQLHRHRNGYPVPMTGPLQVSIEFFLWRPPSVTRSMPSVKPDIDKLIRSVLDSLVDAELITDDALVVHISARKQYAQTVTSVPKSPSGAPGALIRVGLVPGQ